MAKTSLNSQTEQDHHQDRPPPRMVAWPLAVLGGSVCMATHSEMPNLKDGNDLRWHLRFENTFRPAIVVFPVQTSGGLKWKRTARLDCEPIHDDMTKPSCQPVAPNPCTLIARRRSFKRAMIKRQQTGVCNTLHLASQLEGHLQHAWLFSSVCSSVSCLDLLACVSA